MRCMFLVGWLLLILDSVSSFAQRPRQAPATKIPTLEDEALSSVPPQGLDSRQFYNPFYTLLRAGPVSFANRVSRPARYETLVWRYMNDAKETSLMTGQGNVDAFLAAPDNWSEQKLLEQQGRREVYDYGKPLPLERVVLSSVWGAFTVLLFSRVFWQLVHGNRNLF